MFPFNSIKVKYSARSSYKFIYFQHRLYKDIAKSTNLETSKIVHQLIIKLNSRTPITPNLRHVYPPKKFL